MVSTRWAAHQVVGKRQVKTGDEAGETRAVRTTTRKITTRHSRVTESGCV